MKLDLKEFKKIKSEKDHSVFKHEHGHEIKIHHSKLDAKTRGELAALPHLAEGGDVEDKVPYYMMNDIAPAYAPNDMTKGDVSEQDLANIDKSIEERINNPNLPSNFPELTQSEQQRLAVNAGVPGALMGPGAPQLAEDKLSPFKDRAETNVAAQFMKDREKKHQKESDKGQLAYEKEQADLESQNAIRSKAGLPLLHGSLSAPQSDQGQLPQYDPSQGIRTVGYGPTQPQQFAPMDDFGYGKEAQTYGAGAKQYQQGLQQQAQAETEQGQQKAAALQNQLVQQQQLENSFQEHVQHLNSEREALISDIQKQHVNPNHLWEDKSTVGKVSTIIGLLLGGIGAGASGGENLALKALNAQIDRDMDAQKLNINNKHSLLNANRDRFQDEMSAMSATRMMKNDILAHELDLAAAKTSDVNAKARLNAASGQFKMQSASMVQQMAMRQTMLKGMQQTGGQQANPAVRLQQMVRGGFMSPEQHNHAVKELAEAQGMIRADRQIMSAFDQLQKINTVGNTLGSPLQSRKQANAIIGGVIPGLSKETAGRFTEADASYLERMMPAVGDDQKTLLLKRAEVKKLVSQKMNFPLLQGYGIDPSAGLPKDFSQSMRPAVAEKTQIPRKPTVGGF